MEHGEKSWKNMEKDIPGKIWKNSKFKTSAPARNDKVESPDELYSASYWKLFWVNHQKTWNSEWKSPNNNMYKQNRK